jgi:hypothetical protein
MAERQKAQRHRLAHQAYSEKTEAGRHEILHDKITAV